MHNSNILKIFLFGSFLFFISCASSKVQEIQKTEETPAKLKEEKQEQDSLALKDSSALKTTNKDVAHEAFLRYLFLTQAGEKDLAIEFLKYAYSFDSGNRFLAFQLANELSEKGLFNEALEYANKGKSLKGHPNAGEDALLATLYFKHADYDSAKVYYKKAIEKNEEDYEKIYEYSLFLEWKEPLDTLELIRVYNILLPRVNYMKGMFARQAQLLLFSKQDSAFVALLEEAFNATNNISFLADKFSFYERKNQRDSMLTVSQKMYRLFPEDSLTVRLYSATLIATDSLNTALGILKEYTSKNQTDLPVFYYLMGLAYQLKPAPDSARIYYKKVEGDSVLLVRSHEALSQIAFTEKDTLNAIRELDIADSISKGKFITEKVKLFLEIQKYDLLFPVLDTLIVRYFDAMEKEKQEKPAEETIIPAKEKYFWTLSLAAEIHSKYGYKFYYSDPDSANFHYEKSKKYLDLALLQKPGNLQMTFLQASLLERTGKHNEAIALFRKLLTLDSASATVHNYLGYTLIDLNRSEAEVLEGIALVDKALQKEPKNVSFLDSKAWGLFRIRKFKEAAQILESLEVMDSLITEDPVYFEHLGRVYDALNETEKANACYKKLEKLEPKHPYAKAYLRKKND